MINWHRLFGLALIDLLKDSPYVVEEIEPRLYRFPAIDRSGDFSARGRGVRHTSGSELVFSFL